jgi:hypothetical protein
MLEIIAELNSPSPTPTSIFTFATFISGLALFALLYTISSIRYHFRLEITPFPIYKITYVLMAIIGIVTLIIDLYFAKSWNISFLGDLLLTQFFLGTIFLLLVLTWMFISFIFPPKFNKFNYKKFTRTMYIILAKSSDEELSVIADELGRSADSIIKYADTNITAGIMSETSKKTIIANYSCDLLKMIGHRKLCRQIISSAPGTAIEFFKSITRHKNYNIPISSFALNISVEAISNLDSLLYHEDDSVISGLFGYIKPFSYAIYGNYRLIESLAAYHYSPLDLPLTFTSSWNAKQLQAYCRCTLITIENYLQNCNYNDHSMSIVRAINIIKNSCTDIYKINEEIGDYYNSDAYKRLYEITNFAINATKLINEKWTEHLPSYKTTDKFKSNIYDSLADLMFEVIFYAAQIRSPIDKCWSIQYTLVWFRFFDPFNNSGAKKIVLHKLRRLLFNAIKQLNQYPNYKSAEILGICLNVMGFKYDKQYSTQKYYTLHKAIIRWVINNYSRLAIEYPDIAKECLQGNVNYDATVNQLIYRRIQGMKRIPRNDILQLN